MRECVETLRISRPLEECEAHGEQGEVSKSMEGREVVLEDVDTVVPRV